VRGVVLGVLLLVSAVHAEVPVEVRARLEPDTVTIGTRFRYIVEVVTSAGAEVIVGQPAERLGEFDIVDFGVEPPVTREGKTVLTRWYQLVGYRPGEHLIESPPLQYRVAGEDLQDGPVREIRVSVESVLAKTPDATDIRDIKPPEPVPVDWRPYYLLGGAFAVLLVLGALVYWLATRSRRAVAAPPPRPAHEIAAEALAVLRRRNLVAEGAFKEYYSTLSDIVRTYLEQQFHLRAPEMTTEEFLLTTARDGRLDGAHRRLLADFLVESDLVKFARHLPAIADSERAWDAAKRFVTETTREELRAVG
jgi:hypothetical protein